MKVRSRKFLGPEVGGLLGGEGSATARRIVVGMVLGQGKP